MANTRYPDSGVNKLPQTYKIRTQESASPPLITLCYWVARSTVAAASGGMYIAWRDYLLPAFLNLHLLIRRDFEENTNGRTPVTNRLGSHREIAVKRCGPEDPYHAFNLPQRAIIYATVSSPSISGSELGLPIRMMIYIFGQNMPWLIGSGTSAPWWIMWGILKHYPENSFYGIRLILHPNGANVDKEQRQVGHARNPLQSSVLLPLPMLDDSSYAYKKGSHERPTERTARAGMPDSSTVWTRVVCNDLLNLPGLSVFPAWLSSYLLP
ncbi:hypothetical protein BO83DRAFT_408668 [Aspergillus eucalypticola CBS 122712]|uniref:Uncharacterized protein n=1 Tax=Aspergillus eucalypticola (strain CBS 122712 / IBT 29274) TaxID=1448314 RepID=A0A317VFG8_ASPEC|nr:uncharacterized protein BO83DRAFT_408668 [Aspergillus eucalypticola CBS 122712]PWY71961.1 hypothetical protein BO83DRAFT_408668 [Aspergillus eucalypticola CBS 122712]